MSDTEAEYLQPGFDPASLTIPRLRSILVTYNVHYPSNAKKSDLVELFHANVAPQASKILARRARAKRSSMGIVDADEPAQSYDTGLGFEDAQTHAKRRTGRQVSREVEDAADDEMSSRQRQRRTSPRKRQTRSTSYQPQPLASDTDTGHDSDLARARPASSSRRTTAATRARTPRVKLEPTEEETPLPARVPFVPATAPAAAPGSVRPGRKHQHRSSTDEEAVFTDDNPFQSGSSPLAAASNAAARHKQKAGVESLGTVKKQQQRLSAEAALTPEPFYARRKTADATVPTSTSSSFTFVNAETPAPETDEEESESSEEEAEEAEETTDALAPGEEFTPEAQLELAQEEEAQRQRNAAMRLANKKRKQQPVAARRRSLWSALVTPLWVLLLTLLGAYGAWYRQEKIAVGYCGLGRLAVPLLGQQLEGLEMYVHKMVERLPESARDVVQSLDLHVPASFQVLVEPTCEPCPPHAFCYPGFTARCESSYVVKPHALSLGGLVPVAPTCEPDGERARRVKAVADKAIEELRDRRAKWECGDLLEEDGSVAAGPAIEEPLLREVIGDKRSKKMSKEEFDDLWTAAIGEIESREEVEVAEASDSRGLPARLSSTSLARLPFACAVRRSILLSLARYRFALSVLVLIVFGLVYVRARFRARRAMLARVPALVDEALERLIAQKRLFLEDEDYDDPADNPSADDEDLRLDPFLFLPQLRDDVLRATHSLAARERIWKHVRAVVEQNSNVRAGQRQGRNGEVGRAWEWVGPVGMASAAAAGDDNDDGTRRRSSFFFDRSARRRRSGRPSVSAATSRPPTAATPSGLPRDRSAVRATVPAREAQPGAAAAGAADATPGDKPSLLHRRWQESRPAF